MKSNSTGSQLIATMAGGLFRGKNIRVDRPILGFNIVFLAFLSNSALAFESSLNDLSFFGLLACRSLKRNSISRIKSAVSSISGICSGKRVGSENLMEVLSEESVMISGDVIDEFAG